MKRLSFLIKSNLYIAVLVGLYLIVACKSYEPMPIKDPPRVMLTYNYYEYTVQNMDENAKCDLKTLTAFYEGFNIMFSLNEKNQMLFTIENKTNKSLIIDKAKCYVLYDGFSKELFKDVRTGKVTTYNNVQDAISSVQTNESSVTMSIPPYSKWMLPIPETNITTTANPKRVEKTVGDYSLTPYTTETTIEFIIPYTFDYALAKWNTCRNKLYVGNIHVEKQPVRIFDRYYTDRGIEPTRFYYGFAQEEDLKEFDEIEFYNEKAKAFNYNHFYKYGRMK